MEAISHQRKHLQIENIEKKGRGVFTLENIAKGALIERAPVLIIPPQDRSATDNSVIFTYVFMWEPGTTEEDLYKHEGRSAIALGYISLVNHSSKPNANFIRHFDHNMIDLVAARDIQKGEELTIDYQMTLWFDPSA